MSYLTSFLDELSNRDINFEKTPTFIMKSGVSSPMLISLFELGIEDVNLEILATVRRGGASVGQLKGETTIPRGKFGDERSH